MVCLTCVLVSNPESYCLYIYEYPPFLETENDKLPRVPPLTTSLRLDRVLILMHLYENLRSIQAIFDIQFKVFIYGMRDRCVYLTLTLSRSAPVSIYAHLRYL